MGHDAGPVDDGLLRRLRVEQARALLSEADPRRARLAGLARTILDRSG
ncbi:hypothetical protein ACTOB_004260 [Actinoplanes oblitus]|uniref:Uncharacterized protein n=1 Tax=Actinoplanes oblitus TaxID=3040509 RepID=A0ABY8WWF6_9ACTN|nr:hypothetical protein [Actinoplanes oblitus]WIN00546.1 hypothetical protein ACTOB_004260 [Actinoplanes oblitus]